MFLTMLRNIRIPENVTIIQKLSLKHVSCSYFRRLEFLNAFLKQLPPKIRTESGAVCQFGSCQVSDLTPVILVRRLCETV